MFHELSSSVADFIPLDFLETFEKGVCEAGDNVVSIILFLYFLLFQSF